MSGSRTTRPRRRPWRPKHPPQRPSCLGVAVPITHGCDIFEALSAWTDSRGNADCDRIGRNVPNHHGVGANDYVVADRDRPQDLGSWAYLDAVADHRSTPFAGTPQVDYDTLAHNYIIAEN